MVLVAMHVGGTEYKATDGGFDTTGIITTTDGEAADKAGGVITTLCGLCCYVRIVLLL